MTNSVFSLHEDAMWICIEVIPYHLWSIDLFHQMVGGFVDLLEVDLSQDQARSLGFAKIRIRFHLGMSLPELQYISFARYVYPIRFSRCWDICCSAQGSWAPPPPIVYPVGSSGSSSQGRLKLVGKSYKNSKG